MQLVGSFAMAVCVLIAVLTVFVAQAFHGHEDRIRELEEELKRRSPDVPG